MIATKDGKNKLTKSNEFGFEEIRNLDAESREKITQRQILAVKEFVKRSQEKNIHYSWSHCPWLIQFLPVITKFYKEWGKINAVNPTLSGFSGLMGMPKIEANEKLNKSFRPRNLFFKELPKSREILEKIFIEKYGEKINYPVIFKPSIGERCSGVSFVREDSINKFLAKNQDLREIIFEEFIKEKKEFGLSWFKNPNQNKVEIFALTERITPEVIGKGKESLRELIIKKSKDLSITADKQKIIFAGFSESELAEKINGKKNIVRTASISYGTVLKKIDLNKQQKEKLEELVLNLIENFAGIYAGRFDLKANSLTDLLDKKCQIIEMNGVAGAPLDIYDDEIEIEKKYEILFDYFVKVFEIADENISHKRGESVAKGEGLRNILKLFFGKNKTQELPSNVWKDLKEVLKISLKGRFQASDLGKIFQRFKK